MKGSFCVFLISVFYESTKGQCPANVGNNSLTSCEGLAKHGIAVFVDFNKINRPCNCIVTPSFDGELLVTSRGLAVQSCNTQINVQKSLLFVCPAENMISSQTINATINQSVNVHAEYAAQHTSGTFYQCMGFQQNGGLNGNLSVICGSPSATTTTTLTKTVSQTAISTPSIESTSVTVRDKSTEVPVSSNTVNSSVDSFLMNSTQDDPDMLYIIAGSAAGGVIVLVGLVVLIIIIITRSRSGRTNNKSSEADMAHTNQVFDNNPALPDNPLYLSSQPMDELGYSSDQEKQLGLPPTDSKMKKKINLDYDVPPNNKPIADGTPSMPVYAVPKKIQHRTPEVSNGDVYAEVCKPNRSTAKDPVRKSNEEGLLYMEVEQDTAATKQTNTNDKTKITEGVCYAEIKHT